jgi:RHH-type transcriptional regulator, rel operon repressor / antitoxin RelB
MASTTFTLRVETDVKKLAAEALSEWQVAGVRRAMSSLDRGAGIPHDHVKAWVNSWNSKRERPAPKRSAK